MKTWQKRLLYAVGGSAWFAVVFVLTWWLTFPSDQAADYARLQVQQATRGGMSLELASLSPTLTFGVKATDLVLYSVSDEEGVPASPLVQASTASVRVSPFSLLSGPDFSGSASLWGGDATFSAATGTPEGAENPALQGLVFQATGLNAALMPSIPIVAGMELALSGKIDADLDLTMDKGFSSAEGHIRLSGDGLTLPQTSIIIANPGPFLFGESVIDMDVKKGRARIKNGRFTSDAIQIELQGEVELADPLSRSTAQLKITLCMDMEDPELAKLENYVRPGRWESDECYHYSLSGSLSRPRFRPERENRRGGNRMANRRNDNGDDELGGPPPPPDGGPDFQRGPPPEDDADAEERRRRREERLASRRERLRERRAKRDEATEDNPDMERRPARLRPRELEGRQEAPGQGGESDTDEPPAPRGQPMRRDQRMPDEEFFPEEDEFDPPPPRDEFIDEDTDQY